MDLTRDVTYRSFVLNNADIADDTTGGGGVGTGITGCVLDSVAMTDVDVVQFMEKRSQADGMDAGDVYLGVRRTRMSGTLYAKTRPLLYDAYLSLRAALSPVLAQREEPLDKGYRPLYFTLPTNRVADYPSGVIPLRLLALPRAFDCSFGRDMQGGEDEDALALPWQATFVSIDPTMQAQSPQEYALPVQTEVTGATVNASTNLVTKASHGLVAGDRVRFTSLTGGTGLSTDITYYVIAGGLTTDAFAVSLTSGGSAVDVTVNYSDADYVKSGTVSGDVSNRGNYITPVNMLVEVGAASGSISATIGDSTFTITIPASTGTRTIRFDGEKKVLTVEEDDAETPQMSLINFDGESTWPMVDPGTSAYSVTVHGGIVVTGSRFWFYERFA